MFCVFSGLQYVERSHKTVCLHILQIMGDILILFYITCESGYYLHVGKLLHGREAGEVEPGHVLPVLVVISLVL